MKHKLLTFLFALMASVGTIFAETYSGTCGNNLTWNLTDSVLTISGTGEMDDYSTSTDVPWHAYRALINSIVIGDGVTTTGKYTFMACPNLTSVNIPDNITKIGRQAFSDCAALTSVTIGNGVTIVDVTHSLGVV